jgi:hypothetical protein
VKARRSRFQAIVALLAIVALGWVIVHLGPDVLWRAVSGVGWAFAAAMAVHAIQVLADTQLLRLCAGEQAHTRRFLPFLRMQLCGHALNGVLPGLGEASKFSFLAEVLPPEARLATLIRQNVFMVIGSLCLVGLVPPIAALALGLDGAPLAGLFILCAGFLAFAGLCGVFLHVGAGEWPFRILRRLRVPESRVDHWRARWQAVETQRRAEPRHAWMCFALVLVNRASLIAENWVLLRGLHQDGGILLAAVCAAGEQLVAWATQFVPFQAATAEGGTYLLFRAVGRTPAMGVALELLRKTRRIVLLAIATLLIGARQLRATPPPLEDPLAPPTAAPYTPQLPP